VGLYLLVGAGALFAALFALNNLLKLLFRRGRIGFVDILLAFLATLVPLAALVLTQTTDAPDELITRAVILLGAVLAAYSLLIVLLELFRAQRLKGSRGILGMISGLLLMIASISVPFSASYITQQAAAPTSLVDTAAPSTNIAQAETPTAARRTTSPSSTPSPTETPAPTETTTPRPTRTPLATRFQYSTRTPTPTATNVTPCVASVEYNLRLRAAPNADSETLLVIPFGTTVELYGRGIPSANVAGDAEALWWYSTYEGQSGWLDGQFMLVSSACDSLP
jgi:hypothetical protein